MLFVWRDFTSAYKQTILGPAWHVVQPLLTTLTYTLIFGMVARLPTNGVPPFLFYLSGIVFWNYFAQHADGDVEYVRRKCEPTRGRSIFTASPQYHSRSRFRTSSRFVIQLGIFAAVLAYYRLTGTQLEFFCLVGWLHRCCF